MPCPKYWRDSKHHNISHNHAHYALPQVLAGFRIDRGHGGIAVPRVRAVPGRIRNHAHNALPQVPAGFTNNRGHGGIALQVLAASGRIHNHTQNAPSTGGIQNQSTARGTAFPQVLAVPRPTGTVFSSSTGRTTNDPDKPRIRACGGAGWPFPGCGVAGRCKERK